VAAAAGLDEQTVGVLLIPIDAERFAPEPDERWLGRLERPTLVFVGRADDPRKNLPLLLDAFARLRAAVPAARLRLVGRPPQRDALGNGDGVEVAGEVPDVTPLVRTSQLFVLPSRQEGFGIVAAEALACGVPVLSTPCGGPEQLIRDSGGGVVLDGFSPEEFATTAADLLRDAARLAAMRRSGRAHVVREHSRDEFVRRLEAALMSVDAAS
jgi:glycosyltransferase involved in cell wall biosynthesis